MVAGRALEQMVGVGRVSDLTISWVLLGVFAALPMIALNSRPAAQATTSKPMSQRSSFPKSRPEPASWARRVVWITLIASLTLGIGLLTWLKTVNYPLAAREVAIGRNLLSQGDSQASLKSFERAIELAPDVPPYYKYRATVYSDYMERYEEGTADREVECAFQESAMGNSYFDCLAEKAYQIGSDAVSRNPLYLRSYSNLAETALNRSLASPGDYPPEEAIGLYREAHRLSPNNWRYLNQLAFAYIRSDEPEKAKPFVARSLEITGDHPKSAYGLYLKGAAYINTGEMQVGADYIEEALALDGTNNWAGQAHQSLAQVYTSMGSMDLAAEHRSASQQLSIG